MNVRVEVKREGGANDDAVSMGGMSGLTTHMQSQNELALKNHNS